MIACIFTTPLTQFSAILVEVVPNFKHTCDMVLLYWIYFQIMYSNYHKFIGGLNGFTKRFK